VRNLLIFAKLLQGFARGNVFPEKLKRGCKSAGLGLLGQGENRIKGVPAMASRSDCDGCGTAWVSFRPSCLRLFLGRFRRVVSHLKAASRIFPQILSRRFRIAGTFCRQRWFARYARSESLLCPQGFLPDLQLTSSLGFLMPSLLPCLTR
jgi:hypothetical protein